MTLAKVSQRGRLRREAYDFLTPYLHRRREALRLAGVSSLGALHNARARTLLEPLRDAANARLAAAAKAAIGQLEKAAPLTPSEVSQLRREVGELTPARKSCKNRSMSSNRKLEAANGKEKAGVKSSQ